MATNKIITRPLLLINRTNMLGNQKPLLWYFMHDSLIIAQRGAKSSVQTGNSPIIEQMYHRYNRILRNLDEL